MPILSKFKKVFLDLRWLWLFTTGLYIILFNDEAFSVFSSKWVEVARSFVGIFVPIGPGYSLTLFSGEKIYGIYAFWIVIPLFLIIFFGGKAIKESTISTSIKVIINFLILLLLTLAIDLVFTGEWKSVGILINSASL